MERERLDEDPTWEQEGAEARFDGDGDRAELLAEEEAEQEASQRGVDPAILRRAGALSAKRIGAFGDGDESLPDPSAPIVPAAGHALTPTPGLLTAASSLPNTDDAIAAYVLAGLTRLGAPRERVARDPAVWIQRYGAADPFTFMLVPGHRASVALVAWLADADRATAVVALELDAVRAVLGEPLFDRCFGSPDRPPAVGPLQISPRLSDTPLYPLLRFTDGAQPGAGEWYDFYNHRDYADKHPAGTWRKESALCLGNRDGVLIWGAFGAVLDEDGVLRALAQRHDAPRDEDDRAWLERGYGPAESWPPRYVTGFSSSNDGARDRAYDLGSIVGRDRSRALALSTARLADLVRRYGTGS
jgi:hypothetical protein